ncbi:DUF4212 domain-containing protein [Massilia consociata]|uniref:DUF4212 domain-containing protein n=2 Tax=Massilia consociata TaxID=760117 RepID=A0ABV6FJV5_9BURK
MQNDPSPLPHEAARTDMRRAHWERTRRMTLVLVSLWLVVGFGTVAFARELSQFTLFGWPLSFYMAAQGASLVSLAIIGFYAWRMRRLDREHPGAETRA